MVRCRLGVVVVHRQRRERPIIRCLLLLLALLLHVHLALNLGRLSRLRRRVRVPSGRKRTRLVRTIHLHHLGLSIRLSVSVRMVLRDRTEAPRRALGIPSRTGRHGVGVTAGGIARGRRGAHDRRGGGGRSRGGRMLADRVRDVGDRVPVRGGWREGQRRDLRLRRLRVGLREGDGARARALPGCRVMIEVSGWVILLLLHLHMLAAVVGADTVGGRNRLRIMGVGGGAIRGRDGRKTVRVRMGVRLLALRVRVSGIGPSGVASGTAERGRRAASVLGRWGVGV